MHPASSPEEKFAVTRSMPIPSAIESPGERSIYRTTPEQTAGHAW